MRSLTVLSVCILCSLGGAFADRNSHLNLPLLFEENAGQAPPSVRFLARSAGLNIFFTHDGATFAFRHNAQSLRLHFRESSAKELTGEDRATGVSNYLVGSNPKGWYTGIRQFAKVRYHNLYPGVDAVFFGNGTHLEFDLILRPESHLDQVVLDVDGARSMRIQDGDLFLEMNDGELLCRKPITYQIIGGEKRLVEAKYVLHGNEVRFAVGSHSKDSPLIIDPVFDYASYLGGAGAEWAYSVAVDESGSIYVTGLTQSTNFPTSAGLQRSFAGGLGDLFVTKLKPDSNGVQYSTYIGGSAAEGDSQGYVGAIAVDPTGNAYITGVTHSADFPAVNAFQPVFGTRDTCGSGPGGGPCGDAFILKLNPTGTALLYSSFLGGGNHDEGKALAIDAVGNAYVTGITASADFPTTSEAFQRVLHYQDGFVAKVNVDGSRIVYSTLLGGSGYDLSLAIAVDSEARAHVAGMTESSDFPLRQPLDSELDPPWDAFVTILNATGTNVEFSTLLGGGGTQQVLGVALDRANDIYLAGYTDSGDFPIVNAFQPEFGGGGGNGFVTKMKKDGGAIVYSTFLGGQDAISELDAIAVNSRGEAYLAGSGGADFPIVNSARSYAGGADAVLAHLTADGSGLYYSTFFGGSGYELASSVAVDPNGFVVIGGQTASPNMPTHWAAPQRAFGGTSDAFVARFSDTIPNSPILSAPKLINVGTTYVGKASAPKMMRISNTGTLPLNFQSIVPSANVTATSDCGTLQPGYSCDLRASLTLNSAAPGYGTITLYNDAPDSPQTVTVRGTGSYGGDIELVGFTAGNVTSSSGSLSVPFTAVIRNNGPFNAESVALRISNNIGGTECNPCSIGTLAPGANATLRFNRSPSTYGMLPVTASVSTGSRTPDINSENDSQTINVAVPLYSANAPSLDFANQPVNSASEPKRIVFTSNGAGQFRLSFTTTGDFSQTNTCGTSTSDGCYMDVFFRPTVPGTHSAVLTVDETLAGTTQSIPLSGTGVLAPYLWIAPTTLDFGTRMIGRESPVHALTLTNNGSANLQIVSLTATSEFSLSHSCPASLAPAASCGVSITFTPMFPGIRTGNLTIQDNAVGNPHTLALSGIGSTSPLSVVPSALDFGPQRLGSVSTASSITLSNVGGSPIHFSGITTPGPFQQTNDCGTIAPDSACRVYVTFAPSLTGATGGTIIIQDDGFASPRSIPVTGIGVQPIIGFDRASLTFPSTRIDTTSETQFVTVFNTGNSSLRLNAVASTGDYLLTNGCGSTVPPESSCFLVVAFRPTTTGLRSGQIIIESDAPGSPHRVALSGTARPLQLNMLPTSLNFAAQALRTSSTAQTITVINDTSVAAVISSLSTSGDFTQTSNCPQQLLPDASCTISIVFTPLVAGLRTGALSLTESSGIHTVSLSGTGAASNVLLSAANLTYGSVLVGGSSTQTVVLSSTGTAPLVIDTPKISGNGFSYVSACPHSLAPGSSCNITVRFTPYSTGLSQGTLMLYDDAPKSPRTVTLSGTGISVSVNVGRPLRIGRNSPSTKPTASRSQTTRASSQSSSEPAVVLSAVSTGPDEKSVEAAQLEDPPAKSEKTKASCDNNREDKRKICGKLLPKRQTPR